MLNADQKSIIELEYLYQNITKVLKSSLNRKIFAIH